MENKICQCCGMPLNEEIMSKNPDGSLNENYCQWCYADGKFTYHSMDKLIDVCVPHMLKQGFTEEQAHAFMKERLPQLDYWKNQLNFKVEKMQRFKAIGFQKEFAADNSYQEVPKFWEETFKEHFSNHINENKPSNPIEEAIAENGIGEYGVCIDEPSKKSFKYLIAGEYKGGEVPEGLTVHEFPEGLWAIFDCFGPLPEALQETNTQIFEKWLPNNAEYEMSIPASVEWYGEGDTKAPDYHSQIWIPIKKKQ